MRQHFMVPTCAVILAVSYLISPVAAFAELAPVVEASATTPVTSSGGNDASSMLSTEGKLTKLEQQMNNLISMDPMGKIAALQQQIATLRGQLEVQTHQLEQLQIKTQAQYRDINERLTPGTSKPLPNVGSASGVAAPTAEPAAISGAAKKTAIASAVATTSTDDSNDPASEQKAYQAANQLLKNRDYVRATTSLQEFLSHYPNGQYAANAHFWLGEIYLRQNQPDQAVSEFRTVIDQYPLSPKVPDAMLKLGFAYADEGDTAQAKVQLQKVIKQFPGSSTAQLADARLKELK